MIKITQLQPEEIRNLTFEYFIVASGFENRAVYQAQRYAVQAKFRIALGFSSEANDPIRVQNDEILKSLGFDVITLDGEQSTNYHLQKVVADIENMLLNMDKVNIYIDYSSMTRNWYSFLLFSFSNILYRDKVFVYLAYSHANYIPNDNETALNRIVTPLYGFCDLGVPSKPTALIIGLGNEPDRAYGLKEYFDAVPYLFYSDQSYNENYSKEVEQQNSAIFQEVNANNIFGYPIHDLVFTNYILQNLCLTLVEKYRVVIAPCGPKPFSVISMIVALNNGGAIEVWRISPGSSIKKTNRIASGLITTICVEFI